MFTIRCPIQRQHLSNGKVCLVNQLLGENKNSLFYGPFGHTGVDLRTIGTWEYKPYNQKFIDGKWEGYWIREKRDIHEQQGRIPLVAPHDGIIKTVLNDNKQKSGWGMFIEAKPMIEGNQTVQYRTLQWHIETPWRTLRPFAGKVLTTIKNYEVKRGQPLAIGGNNGMSTGPHVHLEVQRRTKFGNGWGAWVKLDPMKYFDDEDIVYHRMYSIGQSEYFYKGEKITKEQAEKITNSLPQVLLEPVAVNGFSYAT